jgi:hypothetical protein
MKLTCKFFRDSRSDRSRLRSDFVTRLNTPASSTTYDSVGGPSFSTSNSDANAGDWTVGTTGQKLTAREIAAAARPCCKCVIQVLFCLDRVGGVLLLRLQEMDLGRWWERDFEVVSLRLSRGVKEMVSIEGNKWRGERNQRGASASLILLVSPDFWWRELLDFHWVVGFELG